jgi:hypothetical protein
VTLRGALEVVAAVAISVEGFAAWRLQRAAYAEHLARLNAAAVADSTHHRDVGALEVARREAEQAHVQLDQKTHEAKLVGTALVNLAIRFGQMQAHTTGTVTSDSNGFVVHGQLDARDTAGLRVDATALVHYGPPTSAQWAWVVDRSPLLLSVDFGCHQDTALAHVTGPRWAGVDITRAVQRPDICNPPPRILGAFAFQLPSLPVGAAILGLGYALGRIF